MTSRLPATSSFARQRGIALFVGMVFLVVLSLVAVIAMQSTFLEMRMATNVARQSEAFQMSESTRAILTGPPATSLFAQSLSQGGWPSSWGGDVPDANFADIGTCVAKMNPIWGNCSLIQDFEAQLKVAHGSTPKVLYGTFDTPGAGGASIETTTNPSTWVTDATMYLTDPNIPGGQISASLSVIPDGGGVNTGAGAAQAAGYRGLGVGSAAGGASRYFQIRSVGLSPSDGSNGRAVTIAQFQAVVGQ